MPCEFKRKDEGICLHTNLPGGGLVAVASLSLGLLTVTSPAAQAAVFHCPTSTICVHADNNFGGARQDISGFAAYTDLNGHLHDKASSWINANRYVSMGIGEWRRGSGEFIAQTLPPGWYEDNLGRNANFDNKADFVKQV